jgi:hypothetical protein
MKFALSLLGILMTLLRSMQDFKSIPMKKNTSDSLVRKGYVPVSTPSKDLDLPDTWAKQACEQVGGKYAENQPICLCPPGSIFSFRVDLDSGLPYAGCIPIKITSNQKSKQSLFSQGALLRLDESSWEHLEPTSWKLSLPNLWQPIATSYLSRFSESAPFLPTLEDLTTPMEYLGFPHFLPQGHRGALKFKGRFLLEPDAERLKDGLQGFTKLPRAKVRLPDCFEDSLSEAIFSVLDFLEEEKNKEQNKQYEAHSQYGCAELCQFTQEWPIDPGMDLPTKKYRARWTKTYLSAASFQNWIQILDSRGNTVAQIFLTPIEDVSHLVLSQAPGFPNQSKITWSFPLYDRSGNLLAEYKTREEDAPILQEEEASFLRYPKNSMLNPKDPQAYEKSSARAVICEQGFPTLRDPEKEESILLGPHLQESFYGWVRLPKTFSSPLSGPSTSSYWSGTSIQTKLTAGTLGNDSHPTHAKEVSQAYLNAQGESIVPLGILDCITRPELWVESVREHQVKVVNLSSLFAYDVTSCAKTKLVHTIQTSKLLWVLAAGNAAARVDQKRSYACPTNQGVLPELLSVASGNLEGTIDRSIATWGIEVADLVAPGPYSSLAAPQVSATAARIAKLYENLTPAQIKLAILLGVTLASDARGQLQFQEVRSGGSLNPEKALAIAEKLSAERARHGNHLLTHRNALLPMLQEIHCPFPHRHKKNYKRCHNTPLLNKQIQQRLQRLESTGILSFPEK